MSCVIWVNLIHLKICTMNCLHPRENRCSAEYVVMSHLFKPGQHTRKSIQQKSIGNLEKCGRKHGCEKPNMYMKLLRIIHHQPKTIFYCIYIIDKRKWILSVCPCPFCEVNRRGTLIERHNRALVLNLNLDS